jgi:transcriptional regulator with XRE-family HTH domain
VSVLAYIVGRCLLREHLRKNDMTQLELAERMGITVQQINKYVLNRQIMSLKVAKNVASILGCRIDDLYEWEKVGM